MSVYEQASRKIDKELSPQLILLVSSGMLREQIISLLPSYYHWCDNRLFEDDYMRLELKPHLMIAEQIVYKKKAGEIDSFIQNKRVPLILLLENNTLADRLVALKQGAVVSLQKDLNREEFFLTVNNLVRLQLGTKGENQTYIIDDLNEFIDYKIKQHQRVSVKDLCQFTHLSQPSLYRKVREEASISPKQLITERQCDKAATMLIETDSTIAEIAYNCGFSNPGYFSQVFKKNRAMSPVRYRLEHQSVKSLSNN